MDRRLIRRMSAIAVVGSLLIGGTAWAETTVCDGGGAAGSGAGRISTVPFTITAPGVYCLTQKISSNLTGTTPAIAINANNVVLDLNGYAIGNLAAGASIPTIGILAVDRQNIVVKNGILRGLWSGVALLIGTSVGLATALSSGNVVDGVTADTCYESGIALNGPFAEVRNSEVINTQGSAVVTATGAVNLGVGIVVVGADAHVIGNTVINTDCTNGCVSTVARPAVAVGIAVAGSASSVVENNTIVNATLPKVANLQNGAASIAILVQQLAGQAASLNEFVINNILTNWGVGVFYLPAGTSTVAATGDFLINGTQGVALPYSGGTNINLGTGTNF